MTAERTAPVFGWRVYGLGVLVLGVVALALGDFLPGQPAPKWLPERTVLAYVAAALMFAAGAAVMWRRTVVGGAAVLAVYYTLFVVVLMDGRQLARHIREYLAYESLAVQLAIAAGAVIVFAAHARIDPAVAGRLIRFARLAFGVCAVLFGVAHFVYMNLTAPLVPHWLPPNQEFWGYATGVAHIAAGVAILTGVQARLAAILLTAMFASFTPLVHLPMLLADPSNHGVWGENAVNLALTGSAWVVADSLRPTR